MINLLGIGLDYLMLKNDSVRGDVRDRQLVYANRLKSLTMVVYSPKRLRLKHEQWSHNLSVYPTNSINKLFFVFDALKIASKICKERKIDALTCEDPFTTGFIGHLLKRRFGIPLNVQVHSNFCNNPYWTKNRRINRFFKHLGKYVLRRADTIRVGTSTDKKSLIHIGIEEEKIKIIPVHMDLEKFRQGNGTKIRNQLLSSRFQKIIMFVGRLSKEKDVPTLLKAFRQICNNRSDVVLALIGEGSERNRLENMVERLNIKDNVLLLGSISHDELPNYLDASDVFVISSLFEGTCIAMAEALAVGLPVVSTGVAGAFDLIIDEKNGFIVDQGDYIAIADKLSHILNNQNMFCNIKSCNNDVLNKIFNEDNNINKLIQLWTQTTISDYGKISTKKDNKLKIITTYKIDKCDLWDKNVSFINVAKRRPHTKYNLFNKIIKFLDDMKLIYNFFSSRRRYNILLTNSDRTSNIFAILQSLLGKKIHHVMLNCLWTLPKNKFHRFLRLKFFKMVVAGVDKCIVFSSNEVRDFHKLFKIPINKLVFIPFYHTPIAGEYTTSKGNYIFSGGHPHYRDFPTLLEALKNTDIKCKLATQKPEYFSHMDVSSNVDISRFSQDEYFKCMANSELVVVPLRKDLMRTAGQRSYLDAMLLGKPVIVCDSKGASDYIDNGRDGIIVPPGDRKLLKEAIAKVLGSENDVAAMSRRAKEKAKRFSIENTMRKVLILLEEVANKKL